LHPPQHLKDQLLQNGKNNLVLRQVALAMMQQQQHQQTSASNLMTANAATLTNTSTQAANTPTQYATFATSPNAIGATSNSAGASQLIPATLHNGTILNTTFPQTVQFANANGQLMPIIAAGNHGFHHMTASAASAAAQNLHMQQAANLFAAPDGAFIHQVAASANSTNPNGLLPAQQRTDRLQVRGL
jgi:hypothetical protein